jgi:hypothetical protein
LEQDLLAEDDERPCHLALQAIAGSDLSLDPGQAQHMLTFDKAAFRKIFLAKAARNLAFQRYDRALAVQAMLRGKAYKRQCPGRV